MNKIKYAFIVSIMFMFNITTLYGASINKEVRVGLESNYKSVDSIIINNSQIEFGYNEGNSFQSGGMLNAVNSFYVKSSSNYFLKLEQEYLSFQEALNAVEAHRNSGYNAGVGYEVNNIWYVVIGEFNEEQAIAAQSELSGIILPPKDRRTVLYDGSNMAVLFESSNSPQIKGLNDDYINLSGKRYRGRIELLFLNSTNFTVVNVLSLEEYLYAVVPSEMPSSWHLEALKAQAVAARTYAYNSYNKHSVNGYNMCDLEHCQVYLGVNNEIESTTGAVNGTQGLIAYYNNMPIDAVFHSSNGGVTANSGEVWATDVPYLQEKLDPYDKEGKQWTRTLSLSDLDFLLSKNSVSIGKAKGIAIDKISLNGRVLQLSIIGTEGKHKLEKESIRYFFADGKLPSLESRVFTIENNDGTSETIDTTTTINYKVTTTNGIEVITDGFNNFYVYIGNTYSSIQDDKISVIGKNGVVEYSKKVLNDKVTTTTTDSIVISGKGWGHGVGMSQYGAKGMAESGYSFLDILSFYYTDVSIR